MSDHYFDSAMDAAAGLGLPLLLATSSAPAVPRHAERLSEFSPELMHGSRLFRRFPFPKGTAAPTIWVTGPRGTTEHLVWAVGLAEQAARGGLVAYLADLEPMPPLRVLTSGPGRPLPAAVRARLASVGADPSASWASDLQGVRVVLPGAPAKDDAGPLPEQWVLFVARSIPEADEFRLHGCEAIDGICFVAAIRDHTREELAEGVRLLREGGRNLLGMVAMGPLPVSQSSPLERWERRPEVPSPGVPAGPTIPEPQAVGFESGLKRTVPAEPRAEGVRTVEEPVRLISRWQRSRRGSPIPWIVLGLCVLAISIAIWFRIGGGSSDRLIPKGLSRSARELAPQLGGRETGRHATEEVAQDRALMEPDQLPVLEAQAPPPASADSTPSSLPNVAERGPEGAQGPLERAQSDSAAALERGQLEAAVTDSGNAPVRPAAAERLPAGPESSNAQSVSDVATEGWQDTFVVHVSSFRRRGEADQEASRLRASGVDARVLSVVLPERGRWHRVVVGAFPDSAAAAREAYRLRADGLVTFAQMVGRGGRGVPRGEGAQ